MLGRAHNVKMTSPRVAAKTSTTSKTSFTMQSLWRLALWGSTATAALFVAILMGRSEVGSQRGAIMLSSLNLTSTPSLRAGQGAAQLASRENQGAPRQFDADPATRQLAQAVRSLTEDRDRLMARLAAVEHNLDDMTGSITRQVEAAKAANAQALPPPWPNEEPPVAATPTTPAAPVTIAAFAVPVAPVVPPAAGVASPLPPSPLTPAAIQWPPDAAASASPPAYGADIGSALSIKALQARWAGVRLAHPQLFEGLEPVVTLRENARSNRIELRLLVGPLPSAEAAAQLCASLAAFRLFCQPAMFEGRHLALQ
jgi:hypothetical protein